MRPNVNDMLRTQAITAHRDDVAACQIFGDKKPFFVLFWIPVGYKPMVVSTWIEQESRDDARVTTLLFLGGHSSSVALSCLVFIVINPVLAVYDLLCCYNNIGDFVCHGLSYEPLAKS